MTKHLQKSLFLLYFFLLFYLTFLTERRNTNTDFRKTANFDFIKKLDWMFKYSQLHPKVQFALLENFLGNILLFVPFVAAVSVLFSRFFSFFGAFLLVFLSSLTIESMQFLSNRGVFDVLDVLLNVVGGMMGYWIWRGFDYKNRWDKSVRE